jgi:class 3 adenylate cyclase
MSRAQAKSFATPDEVRDLPKIRYATVHLGESTVGHCRFEPGWRWSVDVGPVFGRDSCPIRHVGYCISGRARFELDDGEALEVGPDSAFDIPAGHDHWVVGDDAWETIEWGGSGRAAQTILEEPTDREFATVLFTDIVDSTSTAGRLGDARWHEVLTAHNGRLRTLLNVHGGREVNTTGDGLVSVFDRPTHAVRCGRDMAQADHDGDVHIRVGIHTGEVEFVGDDVRGIAVHVAARVLALAGRDEVVVSSTTRDLLEGSNLEFEDVGTHELKGLSGARRLYRLVQGAARRR